MSVPVLQSSLPQTGGFSPMGPVLFMCYRGFKNVNWEFKSSPLNWTEFKSHVSDSGTPA